MICRKKYQGGKRRKLHFEDILWKREFEGVELVCIWSGFSWQTVFLNFQGSLGWR